MNRLVLQLSVLIVCLGPAGGCRFQRHPVKDPYASDARLGADAQALQETPSADGGVEGGAPSDDSSNPLTDAGDQQEAAAGPADAAPTTDAASDALAMPRQGDSGAAPPEECDEPQVTTCDPVHNTGCADELLMQCAVDFAAPQLAGYCIFSAPQPVGCLNTLLTESCPPTTACVAGQCRRLCFCDSQCEGGQCCVEPIGNFGFKVCGEC